MVFAVLTTVVAFMPLMFVPGGMGKMSRVIPLVVIPCLLFSLIESLGILPAHLAHIRRRPDASGPWRRFQQFFASGLKAFVRTVYQPLLETALRWRYVTAAIGLSTLILTGGMVVGGWANFHFFPSIEADFMAAAITMPQGTPVDMTSQAVDKLEAGAERLRARLERETGMDYFPHVSASVGDQPMMSRGGGPTVPMEAASAANLGEVTVELAPPEARAYTSEQLGLMWREETGPIPEVVEVNFNTSAMSPGDDVDVQLAGSDIADYPGVFYTFEGAQAQQVETMGGLQSGFLLALLMIFALLAVPLRSYVQPLIIMAAIPFGLVGAIWGHMVMGLDVTSISMLGLVALTGVVVNDSLVMVDFINRARNVHADLGRKVRQAGGQPGDRHEFESTRLQLAIREAGGNRFRPILLTSLTTFFGLAPLMLERSMQAAFLVPMAVSLAFGVLFATFITLILVPTLYLILDDVQRTMRRMFGRGEPALAPEAPL